MDEARLEPGRPRRRRLLAEDRDLRYERLITLLRLYRSLLFLCLFVIVVLATVLIADRRHRIAHAILIDGKVACLVESKTAADQVRQYLLSSAQGRAGGPPGGAAFREHWSDEDRPVGDSHVLSVTEAANRLRPLLNVVVSATAVSVDGRQSVVLADHDTANKALEALKARFLAPGQKLIEQRLLNRVELVETQVGPQYVFTDISQAVSRLLQGNAEITTYVAKPGDTVERLAALFATSPQELLADNPGLRRALQAPGKPLQIKLTVPPVRVETVKEVVQEQAYTLPPEVTPTATLPKGEKHVVAPGQPGRKRVTVRETWENGKLVKSVVLASQVLTPAVAGKVEVGQKSGPSLTPAR